MNMTVELTNRELEIIEDALYDRERKLRSAAETWRAAGRIETALDVLGRKRETEELSSKILMYRTVSYERKTYYLYGDPEEITEYDYADGREVTFREAPATRNNRAYLVHWDKIDGAWIVTDVSPN